ncbi:MAG: hypothetical protein DRG30_06765 [Epsilonproteobacteria bacterium]|nr:MAG: hypothetical protein DRG30_06765 [Campylobacterota bacterium]
MDKSMVALLKADILKSGGSRESIGIIAKYSKKITGAERCSLFLYNKKKDQLRSVYTDGIKGAIVLKSNAGIVGYAFHKRESVLENDTTASSLFLKAVDRQSGYTTKRVLAVPVVDANNKRLGVIQLLNKEKNFTDTDKENIEILAKITATILEPWVEASQTVDPAKSKEKNNLEALQKKFDIYLSDKKLYFMEDGSVYYKILNMARAYFIAADKCYLLEDIPKKTEIFHYTTINNDFLPLDMSLKIDKKADALLIKDKIGQHNFTSYPLEED